MNLASYEIAAIAEKVGYVADGVETATAGQEFKIELPGNDVLAETVPSGKNWSIVIHLEITETDA